MKLFSRPGKSKSSMAVSCKMLKKPEKRATAVLMVAPENSHGKTRGHCGHCKNDQKQSDAKISVTGSGYIDLH